MIDYQKFMKAWKKTVSASNTLAWHDITELLENMLQSECITKPQYLELLHIAMER